MAAAPARAASYVVQDIWWSTLYGGAIGGVAGTGAMLLTDEPEDHAKFIVTGIGAGVLAGLVYGIYSYSVAYGDQVARNRAVANIDPNGHTRYRVPLPQAFVARQGLHREDVGIKIDLLHGRF